MVQTLLLLDDINGHKWWPLDGQLIRFIAGKNASFSQIPNIPPLWQVMQFHLTPQRGGGDMETWALFEEHHCDLNLMQTHTHTHSCQLAINNRKTSSAQED